jgi:hypothetical protein
MENPKGTVLMSGETMEVLLEAGCVTDCAPELVMKLPGVMNQLCKTLSVKDVARFFIHDVRIGETVALIDKVNGYTYRIRMDAHAVRVLEVHESGRHPANDVQAVYFMNWGLLRAVSNRQAVAA